MHSSSPCVSSIGISDHGVCSYRLRDNSWLWQGEMRGSTSYCNNNMRPLICSLGTGKSALGQSSVMHNITDVSDLTASGGLQRNARNLRTLHDLALYNAWL
jgi:hypothetical protein